MVDRVYKADLPRLRTALEKLREGFSDLDSSGTDWIGLRIVPLLKHLDSLQQVLQSEEFSQESSHLRRGVKMFHSDLVYFRTNIESLKETLQVEKSKERESE